MRTGAKLAVATAVVAVATVGLVWWPRVAVVDQDQSADLISYAIFTGPRAAGEPEVQVAGRDHTFNDGATVPAEWRGVLEGISNARLDGACWVDVLRFLPDRLPEEQSRSWGVEEVEVVDARAGKLDIAYVRVVCGRPQH